MIRKTLFALAAATISLLGLASAASAQTYNQFQPTQVQTSTQTPVAGGQMTISVCCVAANSDATATLFSDPVSLGTFKANAQGAVNATVRIPTNTTAGTHHIEVSGVNSAGQPVKFTTANFTVVAAASLSRTGASSTVPLAATGAGLAAVGAGLVYLVRRRRLTPASVPSAA